MRQFALPSYFQCHLIDRRLPELANILGDFGVRRFNNGRRLGLCVRGCFTLTLLDLIGNAALVGILVEGLDNGQRDGLVSLGSFDYEAEPIDIVFVNDPLQDGFDMAYGCFFAAR